MASKHNFRKLEIWKSGIELSMENYQITRRFPMEERYGLSSQLQRAGVSIPSNIAEGTARSSDKHFKQFLEHALGSAYEWETQLILAGEVGYVSDEKFEELERQVQKIQGQISRFIDKLDIK